MNATATSPNTGPAIIAAGSTLIRSSCVVERSNKGAEPKNLSENQDEEMLATAIGAMARSEKWRRTASWANTTPAIGALKPAAIAPATPQPMKTSVVRNRPEIWRRALPSSPQNGPTVRIVQQMRHLPPKLGLQGLNRSLRVCRVHCRFGARHKCCPLGHASAQCQEQSLSKRRLQQ